MALKVIELGACWVGRVDDWNAVDCFEDVLRRSLSVDSDVKVGTNVSTLSKRKKERSGSAVTESMFSS